MNKKFQIFISSTYEDLKEERAKVVATILKSYHFPIGMEMFSADNVEQWQQIQRTIDSSDYYILIIKRRYGSMTKEGISYTEKEYNYAKERKIPTLAFIIGENANILNKDIENDPEKNKLLSEFIKRVKNDNPCDFWNNSDELCTLVNQALQKQFDMNERIGWVREDTKYTLSNIVHEYVDSQIPSCCYGLADIMTARLDKMLHFKNVIKKIKRIINVIFLDDKLIKVSITNLEEYYCHSNKFQILFNACRQQAESFEVTQLKLNNIEYLDKVQINKQCIQSSDAFNYQVQCDELILDQPIQKIEYSNSYCTNIDDFFISYKIHSPCYEFNVIVTLNHSKDNYSVLCSTFSSAERVKQKDYSDYELHANNICSINFPTWSLPGSGYVVTIKKNN